MKIVEKKTKFKETGTSYEQIACENNPKKETIWKKVKESSKLLYLFFCNFDDCCQIFSLEGKLGARLYLHLGLRFS